MENCEYGKEVSEVSSSCSQESWYSTIQTLWLCTVSYRNFGSVCAILTETVLTQQLGKYREAILYNEKKFCVFVVVINRWGSVHWSAT